MRLWMLCSVRLDIGKHFPDNDEKYRGADSLWLLECVRGKVKEAGYVVGNVDATIIAQKPKMRPYIESMRENVAKALCVDVSQINIKATTEEGLGFTGNGEGISAQAVASINSVANYMYENSYVTGSDGGCAGCQGCTRR